MDDGDGDVRSNLLDDCGGGTGEDTNVSHIHGGRPESLFISIYLSNVYDLNEKRFFLVSRKKKRKKRESYKNRFSDRILSKMKIRFCI